MTSDDADLRQRVARATDSIRARLKGRIVGLENATELILTSIFAGGHCLLVGVPGLAKTSLVRFIAESMDLTFRRIQFTPDLVPSDLVGTRIYRAGDGFDTELGPVFCNFLLADEINRAPAKVQSALLEVMQEHQVTIGGETYWVPEPFLVLATQNPIEAEGTYPLPEAQVDRFMLKVLVDYPDFTDELAVVQRSLGGKPPLHAVVSVDELAAMQRTASGVYVDPHVATYAVSLTLATRRPEERGLTDLSRYVAYGASPRGSISLVHAARALALIRGRSYALPQDVRDLAKDVLRHRLVLTYEALAEGVTPDTLLDAVLAAVPLPQIDLGQEAA
jgi:MoxR-like ATPase